MVSADQPGESLKAVPALAGWKSMFHVGPIVLGRGHGRQYCNESQNKQLAGSHFLPAFLTNRTRPASISTPPRDKRGTWAFPWE
jgi:hypothetical protein